METQPTLQLGGFAAEPPPRVSFLYVGSDEGAWEPSPVPGFLRRSLGGAAATGGVLEAWDVRASPDAGAGEWVSYDAAFHALFVAAGSAWLECAEGRNIVLAVGDVVCFPRGYHHRLSGTAGLRLLTVESPAGAAILAAPAPAAEGALLVHREAPEAYDIGVSPTASRRFLKYREIPLPEAAEGLVRAEVIRAHVGGHSSGWHLHPMAQIVFAIQGRALVDVDGHGTKELVPGTAIYLPAGLAHNLRDISDDYGLFEAFVPGIGGTTQCAPPAGWEEGRP